MNSTNLESGVTISSTQDLGKLLKQVRKSSRINQATIAGLKGLRSPDQVAALRGKSAEEVTPGGVLRAYRESQRLAKLGATEGNH